MTFTLCNDKIKEKFLSGVSVLKKIRLLHTGDMHLGSQFATLESTSALIRKKELEKTCTDIICKSENYDIVLLAGDVFDSGNVSREIADGLLNCISENGKTRFFWSCGNHDPYESTIMKYCRKNCPGNLYIFSPDAIECKQIPELGICIWGRSFKTGRVLSSFLDDFTTELNGEHKNILCMHSEITDSEGIYNPVSVKSIADTLFDYVALGHIHSYSGMQTAGKTTYSYCGCPEGRGFDECGDKGCVSVEISDMGVRADFVSMAKRKYICEKIDVSDIVSYDEIISLINDIVGSGNLCKIEFVGENRISPLLNTEYIEHSTNTFYIESIDSTHPALNPEEVKDGISLIGLCAAKALEMNNDAQNNEEKELIRKAFALLKTEFDKW